MRNVRFTALAAAIYAVACLTIGIAHDPGPTTPGAGAPAFAAEISALALPDGTNVPICGETSRGPAQKGARKSCDACRLIAASGLPPTPPLEFLRPAVCRRRGDFPEPGAHAARGAGRRGAPARPPGLLLTFRGDPGLRMAMRRPGRLLRGATAIGSPAPARFRHWREFMEGSFAITPDIAAELAAEVGGEVG